MSQFFWPAKLEQRHVEGARLFANRNELMKSLSFYRGSVVAEIGVLAGDFTDILIRALDPARFHAYDVFTMHELEGPAGARAREKFKGATQLDHYVARFEDRLDAGTLEIFCGDSSTLLALQPDAT